MAFEHLTLFEFNVEDAQIGPKAIGSEADGEEVLEANEEPDSTRRPRRVLPLVALSLVLALVATIAARRYFRSDDEGGIDVEEDVAVEEPIES